MKKNLFAISIILIVIGIFAMNYDRVAYKTERERRGIGPFTYVEERERTVSVSKVLGILALVAGGVILLSKLKRK